MRCISVLLIVFLLAPLLVAQGPSNDDKIYDEVRRRLANDVDVKGGALDVVVKNGVVTLSGRVHTAKAREKAEKIVKKIKGVTTVDNQLKLFGAED